MDCNTFQICSARIHGSHFKSDPRFLFNMIVAEMENIPIGYSAGYLSELISEMITWFAMRQLGNTWWDYFKYDPKLIGAQIMDHNFNILPILFLNLYIFCSSVCFMYILRSVTWFWSNGKFVDASHRNNYDNHIKKLFCDLTNHHTTNYIGN